MEYFTIKSLTHWCQDSSLTNNRNNAMIWIERPIFAHYSCEVSYGRHVFAISVHSQDITSWLSKYLLNRRWHDIPIMWQQVKVTFEELLLKNIRRILKERVHFWMVYFTVLIFLHIINILTKITIITSSLSFVANYMLLHIKGIISLQLTYSAQAQGRYVVIVTGLTFLPQWREWLVTQIFWKLYNRVTNHILFPYHYNK